MEFLERRSGTISRLFPYLYPFLISLFFFLVIFLATFYREIDRILREQENVSIVFIYILILLLFSLFMSGYFAFKYIVSKSKSESLIKLIEGMSYFKQGVVEKTISIEKDGSCVMESIYEILGVTGATEERTFKHKASAGSSFNIEEIQFKVVDLPIGVEMKQTILEQTDEVVISKISFHPGLKSGETARVLLRERFSKFFKMRRGEIINQIREKKWEFDRPYEFTSVTLILETEELRLRLIFPENWLIPNRDIAFDVVIGFGFQRDWSEYLKVKEGSRFNISRNNNRIEVTLDVLNPATGSTYSIFWKPPGD